MSAEATTTTDIEQTSIEWPIKSWASRVDLIKDNAQFLLTINKKQGDQVGSPPPAQLQFYFRSYDERDRTTVGVANSWVSLYMRVNLNGDKRKLIVADVVTDTTNHPEVVNQVFGFRVTPEHDGKHLLVQQKFIHLQDHRFSYDSNGILIKETKNIPQDAELRLRITVVVFSCVDTSRNESDKKKRRESPTKQRVTEATLYAHWLAEVSLSKDLALQYGAQNDFPDLKLMVKEGVILKAHRFILAARSHGFSKIIEGIQTKDFQAIITLPTVSVGQMKIVLHWMYTGHIHEDLHKQMAQVVEMCIKFEIFKLLRVLEKEFTTCSCSTDNMIVD